MAHRSTHSLARKLLVTFLVAATAAPSAYAIESQSQAIGVRAALGSRARIVLTSAEAIAMVGTITAMDEGSITIQTMGGAAIRTPRTEIRSLQISVEQKSNIMKGALIGAGSMAVLGAALGAASCGESAGSAESIAYWGGASDCTRAEGALILGAVMAGGGGIWGALIGGRSRSDKWIDLPNRQVSRGEPSVIPQDPRAQGPPTPLGGAVVSPPPLIPGTGTRLFSGTRVRVMHGGQRSEGLLVEMSDTALILAGSSGTVTIPRSAVARIDTWAGEKRRPLKGAIVGLLSGAVLDFTSEPFCSREGGFTTDCSRAASVVETAAGGALIGAGIGLLVKKTTWIPVNLNEPRASAEEIPQNGPALRVSPILGRNRGAGLKVQVAW